MLFRSQRSSTDDLRELDVRLMARKGVLNPGFTWGRQWLRLGKAVGSIQLQTGHDRVTLIYKHRSNGQDWKDEAYPVLLDRTPCVLGGTRPWFRCPVRGCAVSSITVAMLDQPKAVKTVKRFT